MTADVPWSVNAVEPNTWATAREAARRAGLSVGEWLEAAIRGSAGEYTISRSPNYPRGNNDQLQHQLNDISERLDHLMQTHPQQGRTKPREERSDSRLLHSVETLTDRIDGLIDDVRSKDQSAPYQIKTAIDRLDSRMETLFLQGRAAAPSREPEIERKLSEIAREIENMSRRIAHENTRYAASQRPPSIAELDAAIAEITVRQAALDDGGHSRDLERKLAAIDARFGFAQHSDVQLTGLEHQIKSLADEMQAFRCAADQSDSIDMLRREVSDLTRLFGDLTPRQSIEALERTIATLAKRIDRAAFAETHQSVHEIVNALQEIREALSEVKPAESFSAVEYNLQALSSKLDSLNENGLASTIIDRLHAQTTEIRDLLSNALPGDALKTLVGQVEILIQRLEHSPSPNEGAVMDVVRSLERRIDDFAERVEGVTQQPSASPLFDEIKTRLEKIESAFDHRGTFGGLETTMKSLVDKLSSAEERLAGLGSIEKGLSDLIGQMQEVRASAIEVAERAMRVSGRETPPPARNVEISDRLGPVEPNSALKLIPLEAPLLPSVQTSRAKTMEVAEHAMRTSECVTPPPGRTFEFTDRRFPVEPNPTFNPIREEVPRFSPVQRPKAPEIRVEPRSIASDPETASVTSACDKDDYPLEPGSGSPRGKPNQSASERVAISEAALAGLTRPQDQSASTTDYIAAARRAAQAAAQQSVTAEKPNMKASAGALQLLSGKKRALVLGSLLIGIIFGAVRFGGLASMTPVFHSAKPVPVVLPTPSEPDRLGLDDLLAPNNIEPEKTEPEKQSGLASEENLAIVGNPGPKMVPPDAIAALIAKPDIGPDITSSVITQDTTSTPGQNAKVASLPMVSIQAGNLPAAIGTQALRTAALVGDPDAAFEIGSRYFDGKGVTMSTAEAKRWFEIAQAEGSVLAAYRLGNIFEKGTGTTKNLTEASRYYTIAAEGGNTKAMHNLAVLYSEGINGKPDYKTAARWFRMAAERNVKDSQYNLGVLYARGSGVEANLAESFRWFSLAAVQGDTDAAKKRDDVGKRLDQHTLIAARLAVQTWNAIPLDEVANEPRLKADWLKAESTASRKRSVKQ